MVMQKKNNKNNKTIIEASQIQRIAVVVLGMHRSGTSALTRILSLCGCDLPKNLMGAYEFNQAGHWECQDIADINDEILSICRSSWDDILHLDDNFASNPKIIAKKQRMVEIINENYGDSPFFIVKDPRLCLTWPAWEDVFKSLNITPYFILPIRNPLEVSASLQKRDWMTEAKALFLWLKYNLLSEFNSRQSARAFTTYDNLLENWRDICNSINQQLSVDWFKADARVSREINKFLTTDLRHHSVNPELLNKRDDLNGAFQVVFSLLAGKELDDKAQSQFDEIREIIKQSAKIYDPLMAGLENEALNALNNSSIKQAQLDEQIHKVAHLNEQVNLFEERLNALQEAGSAEREALSNEYQQHIATLNEKTSLAEINYLIEQALLEEHKYKVAHLNEQVNLFEERLIALQEAGSAEREALSSEYQQHIATLNEKTSLAENSINEFNNNITALKYQNSLLEKADGDKSEYITILEGRLSKRENEFQTIQGEIAILSEKTILDRAVFEDELQKMKHEFVKQEKDIVENQKNNALLLEENTQNTLDLQELSSKLHSLENMNKELNEAIKLLNLNNSTLLEQNSDLSNRFVQETWLLNKKYTDQVSLHQIVLQEQIDSNEKRLHNLHDRFAKSISWKVTKPFRYIGRNIYHIIKKN